MTQNLDCAPGCATVTLVRGQGAFDIAEYAEVNAEGLFYSDPVAPVVVKLHAPGFLLAQLYPMIFADHANLIERWEKTVIHQAKGIISPSHDLATYIAAGCKLDPNLLTIIPNPVDMREFHPRESSANVSTPNILYLGNLNERKGAFLFAQALNLLFARGCQAHAIFVGQNDTLPSGEKGDTRICHILGPENARHFEIRGYVPHEELESVIHTADVCVTPSIYENCPYVTLEAMACAKPVVATNNSGFPEIIEHGKNGLLFEPGNPEALAVAIQQLISDKSLRTELGQAAHKTISERFAAPEIALRQTEYYLCLLGA